MDSATAVNAPIAKHHPFQKLIAWLQKELQMGPVSTPYAWFANGVDAGNGVYRLQRPWYFFGRKHLHLDWTSRSPCGFEAQIKTHVELSQKTGGRALVLPGGETRLFRRTLGRVQYGQHSADGLVDHAEKFLATRIYT